MVTSNSCVECGAFFAAAAFSDGDKAYLRRISRITTREFADAKWIAPSREETEEQNRTRLFCYSIYPQPAARLDMRWRRKGAMNDLNQQLEDRADERQARDNAVSAFLGLGEKLLSFYGRGKNHEPKSDSQNFIGASALFSTIEGEIIPRLMLAHGVEARENKKPVSDPNELSSQDHELFLNSLMHDSASATHQFVDALLQRGVSREILFLDLLAAAARGLGVLWEKDLCDFTDVTIGLCRLHEILRKNSILDQGAIGTGDAAGKPRILLATACGDQHVFGVVMVAEFFRQEGWRVSSEPGASADQLEEILRHQHFDILGLSAACSVIVDDIEHEVARYRACAKNKGMKILVGGRLFAESPELVARVGADAAATDAKLAPEVGGKLLAANQAYC